MGTELQLAGWADRRRRLPRTVGPGKPSLAFLHASWACCSQMCAAAGNVATHCTQSTVPAEGDALESSPATDVVVGPATGFLGDLHIDGPRRLRHESDMGALPLQ